MPIVESPCSGCPRVRRFACSPGEVPPPGRCVDCLRVRVPKRKTPRDALRVEFARLTASKAWRGTSPDDPRIDARGLTLADAAGELSRQLRELAGNGGAEAPPSYEVGGE